MANFQKISKGSAVFVYTQDLNHAWWFCDDIIGIQKSKVVVSDKSSEVMNEENLCLIYDRECKILEQNEIKFITPDLKLFGAK